MKAVHPRSLHDHITDYCCCNCCCCCFPQHNHCQQQQQQQQQQSSNQQLSIPHWIPNNCKSTQVPNMDSICSCCSCISSIDERQKLQEEDILSLPSTGCTTPIDPKVLLEDENVTPDIEKLRKKKLHAIEELLQTERDYVQDLSYLVEVCLEVLSRQSWITPKHKSTIIRNSPEILAFHKQFLVFNEASSVVINSISIAKAFLDQVKQFSLYTHYCDLHAEAWALTSDYRDKPEWTCFLKDCAILDSYSIPLNLNHILLTPESSSTQQLTQPKKLYFEDYLIKPVQRICRYQLLIKEIIRYTSPETAEYDLWSIVLNEMQDVVTEIDERKFQRDMKERTDRFIDRLEADWRISKRHVAQLGSLLIAGGIEVTYSALGQSVSKPRYLGCFVFPTYIIMVRPKKVTSYEPKHWFPLRMADFEDLSDIEGQREHSFVIRCKKHTFAFSASCSQEKQLWVKKVQEAIVTAKIEASDENLSAQDYIVSSLPGITSKRSPQSIRLSRSFTNILDMTLAGNLTNNGAETERQEQTFSPPERQLLRRSASTSIQFEDIMKMNMQQPPLPKPLTSSVGVTLKKRYSADYSTFANRRPESSFNLKPRNNSEMYIKPDSFGTRRRPSSLDLLSAANNTSNMIGKMSLQLKSNHQNALRVAVDHKLRDVCTQEYLSSRAWHMRDKDQMGYYQSVDTLITSSSTMFNLAGASSSGGSGAAAGGGNDPLKKRKSNSFIRSSASSFSIIIPKRSSESKQYNVRSQQQHHSEYDLQSNTSSCSSSIDRVFTPVGTRFEKAVSSRRPSQSSQLLRRISQSRGCMSESPHSFDSEYSFTSSNLQLQPSRLERSSSRKQIFVGKVLRRIASLHHKSPSPSSFDSFEEFEEVKKAASVDSKRNRIKWRRHEELVQLQVSDRPTMAITNQQQQCNEEALTKVAPVNDTTDTNHTAATTVTAKHIAAFAYASTPSSLDLPTPRPKKMNDGSKWRNRLSMIKPSSFKMRMNSNNNNNNASNITTTTTATTFTTN